MDFINILLYSTVAGLSTIAGAELVRKWEKPVVRNSIYMLSLAVGVILATASFELLPEAISLEKNWPVYLISGILLLYIFEHILTIHSCEDENCETKAMGQISALGIGIHSLLDGFVIGVGFEANFSLGILTSLAVILHELPEGVFTYTLLRHDKIPEAKSQIYAWMVALATPLGAILTFLVIRGASLNFLGGLLAFSAGSFFYIATADLVPETHKKPSPWYFLLIFLGVGITLLIKRLLG